MKKMCLSVLLASALLSGCASNTIYYWGNYENTLYRYTKQPGAETFERHKRELERIIANGQNGERPVPPGIYFELGMMEAKSNNVERAVSLFRKEKQAYPESTQFVDSAISMLERNTG